MLGMGIEDCPRKRWRGSGPHVGIVMFWLSPEPLRTFPQWEAIHVFASIEASWSVFWLSLACGPVLKESHSLFS